MEYELAKKLKDAGYVFKLFPHEVKNKQHFDWLMFDGEMYEFPTLSELIGACGDSFGRLEHVNGYIGWVAYSSKIENKINVTAYIFQQGLIPEEAVANLWLALQ